ncbi:MAG: tetratricopeptide repeat protein [Gammaproteobacteria bacterium]|nr:MAG: tetratricopeptide repeat protein [Gammaproteobacteria bacterium]
MSTLKLSSIRMGLLAALLALLATGCVEPADRAAAYVEKAQAYFDEGNREKALLEVKNALQIEPKNVEARYLLAQLAGSDGQYSAMIENLQIAVEADPGFVPAQVDLGNLQAILGNLDAAEKAAAAAAAVDPDDAGLHVLRARIHLARDETKAALQELEAALASDPSHIDAVALKASLLAATNTDEVIADIDRALAAKTDVAERRRLRTLKASVYQAANRPAELEAEYEALLRDFPRDAFVQDLVAGYYAAAGRLDEAERVRRVAVEQAPDDEQPRLLLARFLLEQRSLAAAREALQQFVQELPESARLKLALGEVEQAAGNEEQALALYREIAAADPRSPEGLSARVKTGQMLLARGEDAAGRQLIEQVLEDAPDYPPALLARAIWRVGEGDLDGAVADLRIILRKEPRNRQANLLLARAYGLQGDLVLARDAYRRLLQIDPSNAVAPRELALLELKEGQLEDAQAVLRERLAEDASDTGAKVVMIDALMDAGDYSAAEAMARQIAGQPGQAALGRLQLARSYQAQRRFDEALAAYRQVLEEQPDSVPALRGLANILVDLGREAEAVQQIQGALDQHPDSPQLRLLAGQVYAGLGRRAEAEAIFRALTADFPQSPQVWVDWANLYRDDSKRLLKILRDGLAANPGHEDLAVLIGAVLERDGRIDDAIAHYRAVLAGYPERDRVANNLASLLLDHRDDAESLAEALRLARRFERSREWYYLDTLGWAHYRNGDRLAAVSYLERAAIAAGEEAARLRQRFGEAAGAQAARGVAVVHYHLGMAYLGADDTVNARRELEQALADPEADFPGRDQAERALAGLAEQA